VGRLSSAFSRAVAAHAQALAHLDAVRRSLTDTAVPLSGPLPQLAGIAERLATVGEALVPGWTGADLTTGPAPGTDRSGGPLLVRVGHAYPLGTARFPAVVPLLGGLHLGINSDARDPRVAGLLRSLVVRLVGACQPGMLQVVPLDPAALGATFMPLRPLIDAKVVAPPAASSDAIRLALDDVQAHAQAAQAGAGDGSWLLVVVATVPPSHSDMARLAALTHTGPDGRICLIAAGWPDSTSGQEAPGLGSATRVRVDGTSIWVGDPPGAAFSRDGRGLAAPVTLDPDPAAAVVAGLAASVGEQVRRASALTFADLIPDTVWDGSSVEGVRTLVGRAGRTPMGLAFDDATPHWLLGGRTGSGKTVFLLDVLYGLAARYSPDELALYLLDFKEGISFTEFTPTPRDPSFIPHARAVGVESDREYGVAVLRELRRELNRRAATLKHHGVTKLSDLRRNQADVAMPRIVTVIDEFQVLFERTDPLAREATALLEELARKGRSYGIHLVLASQTIAGVEALYGKTESIFGQFPLRIALPGGSGVLDTLNTAADTLPLGTAVINTAAGHPAGNMVVRFPDAHADPTTVTQVRHRLWTQATPGAHPPAVFAGYASRHLDDDPTYQQLTPGTRRPVAVVGRVIDVPNSTASFTLDTTPGRHLAIVGTSNIGAHVLHAATVSLARQHTPDAATFLIAPLVPAAGEVADHTIHTMATAGHQVTTLDARSLRDELRKLADPTATHPQGRTYLVVFGVDAASPVLASRDPDTFRAGHDDLQTVLRNGPAYGIHLLGWWRGLRRLADDLGGAGNRDDIACLVALNVPGSELGLYLGEHDLAYEPRPNRALLVDRHDQRTTLIVPFVRPGHLIEEI